MSSNVTETQNPNNSLPETLDRFLYAYLHALLGADEGFGYHGSVLWLLFVMNVMDCYFVGHCHKVVNELIVVLPSMFCCGVASANS